MTLIGGAGRPEATGGVLRAACTDHGARRSEHICGGTAVHPAERLAAPATAGPSSTCVSHLHAIGLTSIAVEKAHLLLNKNNVYAACLGRDGAAEYVPGLLSLFTHDATWADDDIDNPWAAWDVLTE